MGAVVVVNADTGKAVEIPGSDVRADHCGLGEADPPGRRADPRTPQVPVEGRPDGDRQT